MEFVTPILHTSTSPANIFVYQVGIDWAGILLERATGMSLNSYMHRFIFAPLGLENISMFPTQNMKDKLAHMHTRNPDGTISRFDHIQRRPLIVDTEEQVKECFNSGGAGCFAKPQEYCRTFSFPAITSPFSPSHLLNDKAEILATLLNDGTSPKTGAQLLQKSTVDLMFTNQIPEFPQFGRQGIPDAKPWLTNPLPNLYPAPEEEVQGWGLTFMLSGGYTGRSKGTAWWAGLPNLWWWCDRELGVAGLVCTQILPFGDGKVLGLWGKLEADIYQGLVS